MSENLIEFHTGDRVILLTEARYGCHGLIIDKTAESNIFKVRLDMPNPFIDKDEKVVEELFSVEFMMKEQEPTAEMSNEKIVYNYITEGQLMDIAKDVWKDILTKHITKIVGNYATGGLSILNTITRDVAAQYVKDYGNKYRDRIDEIVKQESERETAHEDSDYTIFRDNIACALGTLGREYVEQHKEELSELMKPIIEEKAKEVASEKLYNEISRKMQKSFENIIQEVANSMRSTDNPKFKKDDRVVCTRDKYRGMVGTIKTVEVISKYITDYGVAFDNNPDIATIIREEDLIFEKIE